MQLTGSETEHDVDLVDVAGVETDRVTRLSDSVLELQEVVGQLRRPSHLACSLQAEDKQIEYEAVVLKDEIREL